jgi:hypothetical protein
MSESTPGRGSTARALVLGLALAGLGTWPGCAGESDQITDYTGDQGRRCHIEQYSQPSRAVTLTLDVLFVTDTSASLNPERGAAVDGIVNFIAALPPGSDVNFGVMLAHGSLGTQAGKLYRTSAGEPVVLKSAELSLDQIQRDLRQKLLNVDNEADLGSDGGEEGLYATLQLLSGGNLTTARSQGLFRPTAALAIVYISDENDICAAYPAGVTPVRDPEGREVPAKARDCAGVTADGVLSRLSQTKGDLPLVVAGIVYTSAGSVPRSGENEVGYGYTDLIALNDGLALNLGNFAGIAAGMGEIGRITGQKMQLFHDFKLSHDNADEASIKASVDGSRVPHRFTPVTSTVHLDDSGRFGSEIKIDYCEKP